jgi:predicted nucleotidyltransferase
VSRPALCGEATADAAVAAAVERCAHVLQERLGPRLVGVILTGSFARGEGTVVRVAGGLRVLGDIELLVVLPGRRDTFALRPSLGGWAQEVSRALGEHGVRVELEFGPVEEGYLRHRARPSIFVHDLRAHGQVVWGPPDLLARIPPFAVEDIPREDAVHVVFNRAIEQLEAWDRVETASDEALLDLAYQRLKLRLDLAGSALAFVGRHVASYAERPRAFATLLTDTPALAARLPADFAADLAHAARMKIAPALEDVLPVDPPAGPRSWVRDEIRRAVPALAGVLRWELGRLLGGDAPLRVLLERWLRAQPWRRRARPWAKLALHPLPSPLPLSTRRAARLALRSTPRALTYVAAASAYLALSDGAAASGAAARLLPLGGAPPASAADERAAITAFWRWCIRND